MKFLYIAPEFPANYKNFLISLKNEGIDVYAIGEADFFSMPEDLQTSIKWYEKANLSDFQEVNRALDHIGPIDIVESHDEHWLRLESMINSRFNLSGIKTDFIDTWKKKSVMKKIFKQNNFMVAKGELVQNTNQAITFCDSIGYPVILKPNEGVGAQGVYKVYNENELQKVLTSINTEYLIEEFIDVPIVTYDGLVDYDGNILFDNSLIYSDGIYEFVQGDDPSFYLTRNIDSTLRRAGKKIVSTFLIRRKFFHFEFFKTKDGYIPLEVNCRPPGGPILDMINFSLDDDVYRLYAQMIAGKTGLEINNIKYFCGFVGRRDRHYSIDHDEIISKYSDNIVAFGENPPIFSGAMGRYIYIFKSINEARINEMITTMLQKNYT